MLKLSQSPRCLLTLQIEHLILQDERRGTRIWFTYINKSTTSELRHVFTTERPDNIHLMIMFPSISLIDDAVRTEVEDVGGGFKASRCWWLNIWFTGWLRYSDLEILAWESSVNFIFFSDEYHFVLFYKCWTYMRRHKPKTLMHSKCRPIYHVNHFFPRQNILVIVFFSKIGNLSYAATVFSQKIERNIMK